MLNFTFIQTNNLLIKKELLITESEKYFAFFKLQSNTNNYELRELASIDKTTTIDIGAERFTKSELKEINLFLEEMVLKYG